MAKEKLVKTSPAPKSGKSKNYVAGLIIIIIIIAIVISLNPITAIPDGISVQPASQTVKSGDSFTVNIYTQNLDDIRAFEFTLSYNKDILEISSVSDGEFLKSSGRETYLFRRDPPIEGIEHAATGVIGPGAGVNGDGALVSIQFRAKGPGNSQLGLSDVKLVISQSQLINNVALTNGGIRVV